MKKLKYMSMMGLAVLLLTTWAACSDDTDASGGENPEEARAYTTVTNCRTEWCGGDKGLRSDGGY